MFKQSSNKDRTYVLAILQFFINTLQTKKAKFTSCKIYRPNSSNLVSIYRHRSRNLVTSKKKLFGQLHCVKSVHNRSYSGPYFPAFGLNTDQNKSEYGHFLRNALMFLIFASKTSILDVRRFLDEVTVFLLVTSIAA